jgi:hypothetical protein
MAVDRLHPDDLHLAMPQTVFAVVATETLSPPYASIPHQARKQATAGRPPGFSCEPSSEMEE